MDRDTAYRLNQETRAFYAANAESFSSTRERPWDGWSKVLEYTMPLVKQAAIERRPFRVLDIGCGNLRFEKMLIDAFPGQEFEFYAVDNCPALARNFAQKANVSYRQLDVVECLEAGTLHSELATPPCDLAVAFGFMHHIPLAPWREDLLSALIEHTRPGSIIAIAFWQFAKNEKVAAKSAKITELGCQRLGVALGQASGDYLLGWQGNLNHFRYCHSFTDNELNALERFAASKDATPLVTFSADGPDGKSNKYLILKR